MFFPSLCVLFYSRTNNLPVVLVPAAMGNTSIKIVTHMLVNKAKVFGMLQLMKLKSPFTWSAYSEAKQQEGSWKDD